MLRPILTFAAVALTMSIAAQHTVRLEIKSLPEYHASGSDIYMAGSFNGWNPQDSNYRFKKDEKGNYFIELNLAAGKYEYKLTRGGWDSGECKKAGAGSGNRLLQVDGPLAAAIAVEEWVDRFPAQPKKSTAGKNVQIMDTAFFIPQLKRTRRVWIYLPDGYTGSKTRYPVLYMHDGQNVFDDATSYSGEWGVDEFLDSVTLTKCIVVAVDNGGVKRMNEYNPYDNERFGKAEGDKYVDFLVKTLKPYIDKKYRTEKGKESTFIAGSSMGGLISLYAVLKYPKIFGGAGVFSPAFWISGTQIFDDIRSKGGKVNSRFYFHGGKLEGETMIPDLLKAYNELSAVSGSRMIQVVREEGRHNEAEWRKEFPLFYEWLIDK